MKVAKLMMSMSYIQVFYEFTPLDLKIQAPPINGISKNIA